MNERLIIGYGNTLRGDDGIGVRIVEALEKRGVPAGVRLHTCFQLTPELAADLADYRQVLFIDASASGDPGEIREREVVRRNGGLLEATTHTHSPEDLLEMAFNLYRAVPESRVLTVTGERFDYGERLSAPVREALHQAVRRIEEDLATSASQRT